MVPPAHGPPSKQQRAKLKKEKYVFHNLILPGREYASLTTVSGFYWREKNGNRLVALLRRGRRALLTFSNNTHKPIRAWSVALEVRT
jgi:hypothetical protein